METKIKIGTLILKVYDFMFIGLVCLFLMLMATLNGAGVININFDLAFYPAVVALLLYSVLVVKPRR